MQVLNLKDLGKFYSIFSSNSTKNNKHIQGVIQKFTIEN